MFIRKLLCYLWGIFFPLVLSAGVDNGTMTLFNDSPFILTAVVQASDGTFLGQFTIQPGQQKNVTQNLFSTQIKRPGAPQVSLTPYTVIWQCASDGYYSVCTNVSPGSFLRAGDGAGSHFCKAKEKSDKEAPASTLEKKK